MARIGFIGLGIMGSGMVANLVKAGHEVTVWNRSSNKYPEIQKAGARTANEPSEILEQKRRRNPQQLLLMQSDPREDLLRMVYLFDRKPRQLKK